MIGGERCERKREGGVMGKVGQVCKRMKGGHEYFLFFKQRTAYEIKECDWSSDVCSSDLR